MKKLSLYKAEPDLLEQELHITVKELLFIILIVAIFFIFAFITIPQTYGFL